LDRRAERLRAKLESVEADGFACEELNRIANKEPLDKWASQDGKRERPRDLDAFLAQEKRYVPDINDGVRVNIPPLQKAGLLAADVLAAKDLEKAIWTAPNGVPTSAAGAARANSPTPAGGTENPNASPVGRGRREAPGEGP
jgi:hypothetical protein